MRKEELLPTRDCEAGYGPVAVPSRLPCEGKEPTDKRLASTSCRVLWPSRNVTDGI